MGRSLGRHIRAADVNQYLSTIPANPLPSHRRAVGVILSAAEVSWVVLTLGKLQLPLFAHSEPQKQVSETFVELKMCLEFPSALHVCLDCTTSSLALSHGTGARRHHIASRFGLCLLMANNIKSLFLSLFIIHTLYLACFLFSDLSYPWGRLFLRVGW